MSDRFDQDSLAAALRDPIGLCATCRLARVIGNRRGSLFYLCQLSESDPRFPKYPRLPVLRCPGYQSAASDQVEDS
jgi:hypothetical protein